MTVNLDATEENRDWIKEAARKRREAECREKKAATPPKIPGGTPAPEPPKPNRRA